MTLCHIITSLHHLCRENFDSSPIQVLLLPAQSNIDILEILQEVCIAVVPALATQEFASVPPSQGKLLIQKASWAELRHWRDKVSLFSSPPTVLRDSLRKHRHLYVSEMAVKTGSGSQDFWHRFCPMLSYACGELCVIILLYVVALASHAATRLARICGLKAPCIFCTRLDHALHGKAWFSADLVCSAHCLEVSSLAYCKSHDQLARSDGLCKTCLLACTMVGSSEEVNSSSRSMSRRLCSCCSEVFKNTRNAQKHSETANAVESWDTGCGSEDIHPRSQVSARDNMVSMTSRVVPQHAPAGHPKEKSMHSYLNYCALVLLL